MELGIGIIIGLLIGITILIIEKKLEHKQTSITQTITKNISPPKIKGHIVEEEISDEDITNLLKL